MKTVLITGTSSGFGLLSSIELAKRGYQVVATMRDLSKSTALKELAERENVTGQIEIYQMDVTKEDEIRAVYVEVEKHFGKLDILINNAGFALGGFLEEIPEEHWYQQYETNIFGPIRVTKTFLPLLRKNNGGKIINISSISGYFGFPGLAPYTSSKHALEGFSESLRLELINDNIWVSLIEPAAFKTNIWEKGLAYLDLDKERPAIQKHLIAQVKSNITKSADPLEVVNVIIKICQSNRPKLRYPVGKGAKLLYYVKHLLPWRMIEWAVRKRLQEKR